MTKCILVHIRGRDCVAVEARYHKRCYQAYTKCLTRNENTIEGPTLYDSAFDQFCIEVIEKRIIKNNEILLLGYLLKKFTSCVQAIEMVDVPYQAARLKKRIHMRYPQIVFHTSKTMNKGTLVYVDSMSAGEVADDLQMIWKSRVIRIQKMKATKMTTVTLANNEPTRDKL